MIYYILGVITGLGIAILHTKLAAKHLEDKIVSALKDRQAKVVDMKNPLDEINL